jgi:glutamine synthetase
MGFGFDASSIRGWACDSRVRHAARSDATRFWMDPFAEQPTLCLIGNAVDPITKEGYASIRARWRSAPRVI